MKFGDLEWTVIKINEENSEFFESKCVTHGHQWEVCSVCSEQVTIKDDYVLQWSTQNVPLYGMIETPGTEFGHRSCLFDFRKPLPIMKMPDRFCDTCSVKLTNKMFGINRKTFCSIKCCSK